MNIRRLIDKLYNPFMPRWFDKSMFDYIEGLPKKALVLNVGSGNSILNHKTVNMDIKKFPNVNVVGDAHNLPFKDGSLDCVLCNALLEHTQKPWVVAGEIQRVVRNGGMVCVQSPFLEAIHDKDDYYRFTLKGLKQLFPKFGEIQSGVSSSYSQVFADLLRMFPVSIFEKTWLNYPVRFVMSWLAKPLQYLDFMVRGKPSGYMYARAFYFVGVKV